jgi:hypothetical protein
MIRKTFIIIVLSGLLLMLIPACGGSSSSILGTRPEGTIFGHVVDTVTNTPLSGAVITITSSPFLTDTTGTGQIILTANTYEDGTFSRSDIPTGQIVIAVKRAGYLTPPTQIWALAPGGSGEFYFDMAPGEDPYQAPETDNQRARPSDSKWDEL